MTCIILGMICIILGMIGWRRLKDCHSDHREESNLVFLPIIYNFGNDWLAETQRLSWRSQGGIYLRPQTQSCNKRNSIASLNRLSSPLSLKPLP